MWMTIALTLYVLGMFPIMECALSNPEGYGSGYDKLFLLVFWPFIILILLLQEITYKLVDEWENLKSFHKKMKGVDHDE